MPKKLVVDFHAHILEPQVFKASAGRTVVTGFGAIAEPPRTPGSRRDIWFKQMMDPEAHLEGLDKMGVDVSVISSSTVIQNTAWANSGTGLALDRRCNDMIADWVRRYPGRFVGTFTMPLQDPYLRFRRWSARSSSSVFGSQICPRMSKAFISASRAFVRSGRP